MPGGGPEHRNGSHCPLVHDKKQAFFVRRMIPLAIGVCEGTVATQYIGVERIVSAVWPGAFSDKRQHVGVPSRPDRVGVFATQHRMRETLEAAGAAFPAARVG
ncbi:MAG: hypothetical protein OHK0026_02540 [Rhodocyclaceae bacterium]